MKKLCKLLLVCTLVLSTCLLGGCSVLEDLSNKTPTAEELLSQTYEDASYIDADMTMLLNMSMDMSDLMDEGSGSMSFGMEMDLNIQGTDEVQHLEGDVSIDVLGMSMDVPVESYIMVDGDDIIQYDYDSEADIWTFTESEEGSSFSASNLMSGTSLDAFESYELVEPQKDDKVYTVKAVISMENLSDVLGSDMEDIMGSTELTTDEYDMSEMLMNVTITYDKESLMPTLYEFEIDPDSVEVEGAEFEDFIITMEINEVSDDKDVDIPKSVIKNAVDALDLEMNDFESNLEVESDVISEEDTDDFDSADLYQQLYEETEPASEGITESDTPTASNVAMNSDWVNFDKMQFAVNDNVYTLGETTLQDLIDDGVPFDSEDLINAENNIKPNYTSEPFKIKLGEYWSAQVYVGNYTGDNAKVCDLPITEVYMPVHSDETQNVVSFAFPLNMTEADLVANAGEPTEYDEYTSEDSNYFSHTYYYTKESTMYYGDWGYCFEFNNDGLSYVTLDYMP